MRRAIAAVATCGLLAAACGGDGGGTGGGRAGSSSSRVADIGEGLKGPSGVTATAYARGVEKAAALAFDDQQRLWVATADYTDAGHDGIYVVTQPGATPAEVISGLHTPLGLTWVGQSLYVASKETVEAFGAFDGTTFATRVTILTLPAGVGEVNGLVLAPDGRMRLGISASCDHCTPTEPMSGSVVSFLPDGTDLKTEATRIRAPIGLTYFPGTNDLFVTMNQRDDLGDATPGDWLAVVQNGQSWGFPDCYGQANSTCTGVPRPVAELDKHAAVSGVAIVTASFGSVAGPSAIVAEWSTGVVQHVALTKTDDGYSGVVSAFVTGMKNPVPVILGPDGALYIGDWTTGTIYRIAPT